jgi:hypothetical protein
MSSGEALTVNPKSADNRMVHVDFTNNPHLTSGFSKEYALRVNLSHKNPRMKVGF